MGTISPGREISGRQVAIGEQIFYFGDRRLAVFSPELDLCEKKWRPNSLIWLLHSDLKFRALH
jgi:hypothetical protein